MIIKFTLNGRAKYEYLINEECYYVNPKTISRDIFMNERVDEQQEFIRKTILIAFSHMDYSIELLKPFKAMLPKKTWNMKTVIELEAVANMIGNGIAECDHQALIWAQRISNGETWESVCNEKNKEVLLKDKVIGYVLLKNGNVFNRGINDFISGFRNTLRLTETVPLVITYN